MDAQSSLLNVSLIELAALWRDFAWVLIRSSAMVLAMPAVGSRIFPAKGRIIIILALASVTYISGVSLPDQDPVSLPGLFVVIQEFLIGLTMGFVVQLLFNVFIVGGEAFAMQMGLGFASLVDTERGVQVPMVAQMYVIFTTLLFFAMDGHLALFRLLMTSYTTLPIGEGLPLGQLEGILELGNWMYSSAVRVALPAMAALLVVNLAFGIMARAAPQLNIIAVGFPVTLMLGFVVMLFTLPLLMPLFYEFYTDVLTFNTQLVTP
ncbi:MAG TPA: flagellar biosynthetic protein FliR [Gammaproteobacteria bacterium]|nr:flagellar biosynthetic protein FliR [Gammaproteobacteria bacterium]